MQRTRIKFCGITRVEDALAAARAGADAIGMVLHANSARKISLEMAREIVESLPPFVTPVGLFVDAPMDVIQHTVDELQLRCVQLHGNESPEFVSQLQNVAFINPLPNLAVIKAVRVSLTSFALNLMPWMLARNVKAILLETAGTAESGGTGIQNNWQAIREAQQAGHFKSLPPIIAAGGLKPDNVVDVVRLLHPWAVDVSTGIESSQGIKSLEKMEAFVEAVRNADLK